MGWESVRENENRRRRAGGARAAHKRRTRHSDGVESRVADDELAPAGDDEVRQDAAQCPRECAFAVRETQREEHGGDDVSGRHLRPALVGLDKLRLHMVPGRHRHRHDGVQQNLREAHDDDDLGEAPAAPAQREHDRRADGGEKDEQPEGRFVGAPDDVGDAGATGREGGNEQAAQKAHRRRRPEAHTFSLWHCPFAFAGEWQPWAEPSAPPERNPLRPIVVTEFISLDGVVDSPGGGEYEHAGWTFKDIEFVPEAYAVKGREQEEASALLLGRVTFQEFAPVWPTMDDFATYNAMPKYVVSRTLDDAAVTDIDWADCHVLRSLDEVAKLKEADGGPILVHGSAALVQSLLAAGLVDGFTLLEFPVVLGSGKRLWAEGIGRTDLRLRNTETYSNGIRLAEFDVVQ